MEKSDAAFRTYKLYVALKKHFKDDDYDYFKYGGRLKNLTKNSFESRGDKSQFYTLSKNKHAPELILSNMCKNPETWIGELNTYEAGEVLQNWQKRQQSITYRFKTEIQHMDDDFNSNFVVKKGQHPSVLNLYTKNKISIETLAILTDLVPCQEYWERKISDPLLFPDINRTVKKIRPFLDYDRQKMKLILLDRYEDKT